MKTLDDYIADADETIDRLLAKHQRDWEREKRANPEKYKGKQWEKVYPPTIDLNGLIRARSEALIIAVMEDMQEIADQKGATTVSEEIAARIEAF